MAPHHHGHADSHGHHRHGGLHMYGRTEGPMLWVCLLITTAFVLVEAVAGYFSHSLALMSDAGHNFSDAFSLGLAAYAVWISGKPSNARKTFGYHRVSILVALFNAVTLLVIAIGILIGAAILFVHPQPVEGGLMMWVAGISVFLNTVIALLLRGGARESLNMRAAYIHMAGDALSALGVVAAGLIVKSTGWVYADPCVSILIACFIVWSSIGVVKEAVNVLMEGTPKELNIARLIAAVGCVPHVEAVHDVHVWTVSDRLNFLSAHVEVSGARSMEECGAVIHEINTLLSRDFNIAHATIQTEIAGMCNERARKDPLHCGDIASGVDPH